MCIRDSMRADRKHTPNADPNDMSRPQWVKDASADHGDCVGRHQLDVGLFDEQMGLDFMVSVGWRALAQLQAHIDEHGLDSIIDWDWEPPFAGVTDAETARELAAQIVETQGDATSVPRIRDLAWPDRDECYAETGRVTCTPGECGLRSRSAVHRIDSGGERCWCMTCGAKVIV